MYVLPIILYVHNLDVNLIVQYSVVTTIHRCWGLRGRYGHTFARSHSKHELGVSISAVIFEGFSVTSWCCTVEAWNIYTNFIVMCTGTLPETPQIAFKGCHFLFFTTETCTSNDMGGIISIWISAWSCLRSLQKNEWLAPWICNWFVCEIKLLIY